MSNQQKYKTGVWVWLSRICIYLIGMVFLSLGIVLCVKSQLGISPISSIAYVSQFILPLSFGALTMLFHLANSVIQYVLEHKWLNIKIILQVPVAVLFGVIIDGLEQLIQIEPANVILKWILLIFSVFFTALGMVFMLNMKFVQNPPDGTVNLLSNMLKVEMGRVKIVYDVICVLISILLSLIFLHRIVGFGIATIFSAIFVGRTLSWMQGNVGACLRKRIPF